MAIWKINIGMSSEAQDFGDLIRQYEHYWTRQEERIFFLIIVQIIINGYETTWNNKSRNSSFDQNKVHDPTENLHNFICIAINLLRSVFVQS